jgi:tRNA U38,U39,U40 pseudouridine synthase TruA
VLKKFNAMKCHFFFCVELPTQYSPEVGETKAKTFYTKVKISTNEFLWKQIRQIFHTSKEYTCSYLVVVKCTLAATSRDKNKQNRSWMWDVCVF